MGTIRVDLNADVGESFGAWSVGSDRDLLPFVTSVNIACGFHAGDPRVMDRTVGAAVRAGVAVGAHPGYWDLRGFGRRELTPDVEEIETDVVYQVGALSAFARSHGAAVGHVKPHGGLYTQAAQDEAVARAVAAGVARVDPKLVLIGLASSFAMRRAATAFGLVFAAEAFVDRSYEPDGSLTPRNLEGALILDPAQAAAQAVTIARELMVVARDGSEVGIVADTLCLHGDNPRAADIAWAVRQALAQAEIEVRPLGR
jgi:UPF0271 protein